jgi:hypothetical protein
MQPPQVTNELLNDIREKEVAKATDGKQEMIGELVTNS